MTIKFQLNAAYLFRVELPLLSLLLGGNFVLFNFESVHVMTLKYSSRLCGLILSFQQQQIATTLQNQVPLRGTGEDLHKPVGVKTGTDGCILLLDSSSSKYEPLKV